MQKQIIRDMGDGLILRSATPADADALADMNGQIHSDVPGEIEEHVIAWTRDLLEKPHPTFSPGDFTLVEEAATGKIVSSLNLIPQTWAYEDVLFKVGRPELVGTRPEYRNRGLVRAQFEVIHQWSQERGELVQVITGIPYYYRLFGYEMALNLGGGRVGYKPSIPSLKEGESEPFRVRPATEADLPFIARLYDLSRQRYLVSSIWNEELFRYELSGKSQNNVNRYELRLIESAGGEPVGFLAHPFKRWGSTMAATRYEVWPGISWAAVTPSVIRYLAATGESLPAYQGEEPFEAFDFHLGESHPVYDVLLDRLPRHRPTYAWYLRVADLPGFLRHIIPVLDRRLAASPFVGHSGELKITFYRSGLRLVFEAGHLATVEGWQPYPQGHSGEAGFPGLTFLQLLFGYRSLDELKYAFADCWTNGPEIQALLTSLFPKQASDVWPVA